MSNIRQPQHIHITLPDWLAGHACRYRSEAGAEARMLFVTDTARRHIEHATGGPFAAAIFHAQSHALISLGVNLVDTQQLSALHAEMVAMTLAQRILGTRDLKGYELVTSCEPCAMCLGAIIWSGVSRVISGASDQDARQVGFDEGPKPADWKGELESRGIAVIEGVARIEAAQVLFDYQAQGCPIYNPSR